MIRTLYIFFIALTFSCNAFAQTGSSPATASNSRSLTQSEQAELANLNAEVTRLYQAGEFDKALKVAEMVRQRSETLLGADDPQTISAWMNIGEIQVALNKFKLAAFSFRQALQLQEQRSGPETTLIKALTRLATADRIDKAATLYRRAYDIKYSQTPPAAGLFLLFLQYDCTLAKLKLENERLELQKKAALSYKATDQVMLVENSGILNGRALEIARPVYPSKARQARASGTVSVKLYIDEQGEILHACAITGPDLLKQFAENAAYRSRFSPTMLKGRAIKITGILNYNFVPQ